MQNKKTIAYLITKSNWGGAQKYVYDLATNIPENMESVVITGGDGEMVTQLKESGVPIHQLDSLKRNIHLYSDLKTFIELLVYLRKTKPDILHVNSSKAGGLGALAGRMAGVNNIIFTAHGWAFNENRPKWQKVLIKLLSWVTILLSHTTIAVSDVIYKQILGWYFTKNKTVTIRLGVNNPGFLTRNDSRDFLTEMNPSLKKVSNDTLWLGTIGELHHIKGHRYVFEAIAGSEMLREKVIFIIMGNGELREDYKKRIKELHIEANIFLMGHIQNAAKYLQALDVFILPSLSEAGAYVAHEAGMAKLPVIASNVGGIPCVIKDGETGYLVPSKDPVALRNKIQKVINNMETSKQQGVALHNYVKKNCTKEQMVQQTMQLYSDVKPSSS
ncbi:MAG: glycosyltransferase [Halieaceae bacterium]|jgi:glycosyltransferase involved in cell wall biosynthesis|nr:glycosyltransferase [Halieaceae bacterium]